MTLLTSAVQHRYEGLATSAGSLSCGGAVTHCLPSVGEVCVDVGCGKGGDVLTLARRVGPTGRAIGLDLTQAMLDVARGRAAEQGLSQAEFIRCPLEALALPDATADWALSNCALNHSLDQAAVWREIARVLKPGARFVVSDIYAVEPIEERWRTDPTAVAECWAGARTRAEVLSHVAAAGLVDVQILEEKAPYRKAAATLASFTLFGRKPPAPFSRAEPTQRR